jgi:hypothetical protein
MQISNTTGPGNRWKKTGLQAVSKAYDTKVRAFAYIRSYRPLDTRPAGGSTLELADGHRGGAGRTAAITGIGRKRQKQG